VVLKQHYLEPRDLSIAHAALALGISRKTLSKIVNERGAVTPDMALRLSQALQTSPELWLNLQQAYDLWHARAGEGWRSVRQMAGAGN
jgi:addiction module HigA family antidote